MKRVSIDLTAETELTLRLRAGYYGALEVQFTRDGAPLNLTDADIRYRTSGGEISLGVGSGITITDAQNGKAVIAFSPTLTSGFASEKQFRHECGVKLPGEDQIIAFEGALIVEPSIITWS